MNKPLDRTLQEPAREPWAEDMPPASAPTGRSATVPASPIKPIYHAARLERRRHAADVGFPGQSPYTRGIYATMHRGRTWTQRQLIGLDAARLQRAAARRSWRRAPPRCR